MPVAVFIVNLENVMFCSAEEAFRAICLRVSATMKIF